MCSEPVTRAPLSGWLLANSRARRHQARHLVLGELDLLAAEGGQRQVGDLEIGLLGGGAHVLSRARFVVYVNEVSWPGRWVRPAQAAASSRSCLSCSKRSQSLGLHMLGAAGLGLQPALHRVAQVSFARHPAREGDVRQRDVEPRQQLLERAQALQLTGAVEPVAGGGARRRHQPGLLDIAEHPRRPAGRRRGFVDRQGLHAREPYHERVKVSSGWAPPASLSPAERRLEPLDRHDRGRVTAGQHGHVESRPGRRAAPARPGARPRLSPRLSTRCVAAAWSPITSRVSPIRDGPAGAGRSRRGTRR